MSLSSMFNAVEFVDDLELAAALRSWRGLRAREAHIPPWQVLPNSLLMELVRTRPLTLEELRDLKGMGPVRIERYGAEILELLGALPEECDACHAPDPRIVGVSGERCVSRDGLPSEEVGLCDLARGGGAARSPTPYRVAIEYQLGDEARQRLIDELAGTRRGPVLDDLYAALDVGSARVCIRIEAVRETAA